MTANPVPVIESGLSLHVADVHHTYQVDDTAVVALAGVTLTVRPGETVALLGPSGCGKSTLLSLVTGLQRPTSGRVLIGRDDVTAMSVPELLSLRANRLGVVVQNPGRSLLPYATPEDNIRFAQRAVNPSRIAGLPQPEDLLQVLGLGPLQGQRVHQMSGGEQQRVAVAVALAAVPGILVADEPTSQLDDANRDALVELLLAANAQFGTTVVTVTHDDAVARAHRRFVRMEAGRIEDDTHLDEDVVRVRPDGALPVPDHLRESLPPGSVLRVLPSPDGVRFVRAEELP